MGTHGNGHMSNCFFEVDLPKMPFLDTVDLSVFECRDNELERITVFDVRVKFLKLLNDDVRTCLNNAGLNLSSALIVHHMPGYIDQSPHIDASGERFTYSLNWVFCEAECSYNWYVPRDNKLPNVGKNGIGLTYVRFSKDDVDLIESTLSKGPLFMNTQMIHNGLNLSSFPRMSVCFRFSNTFSNMSELKQHMISHSLCK